MIREHAPRLSAGNPAPSRRRTRPALALVFLVLARSSAFAQIPNLPQAQGTWDPRLFGYGVATAPWVVDASKNKVYVGGEIWAAGDANLEDIAYQDPFSEGWFGFAAWDSTTERWSGLPGGIDPRSIYQSVVFQDDLYVLGSFAAIDGQPFPGLARWDGSAWSPLGTYSGGGGSVKVMDDALYVFGSFSADGFDFDGVGRWDGGAWSKVPFDTDITHLVSIAVRGDEAYIGRYDYADGIQEVSHFDGTSWNEIDWTVYYWDPAPHFLTFFQGEPYVAGGFSYLEPDGANYIARWDGLGWRQVGLGLGDAVTEMVADQDAIYVVTDADPYHAAVERWDGQEWTNLGEISESLPYANGVEGIAVADGKLYVTGAFTAIGDQAVSNLAYWDPEDGLWHGVGDPTAGGFDARVAAAIATEEGVYVAGQFRTSGDRAVAGIARWEDGRWTPVGDSGAIRIDKLAASNGRLFATGIWNRGDGDVSGMSQWDGDTWSPVRSLAGFAFDEIASANGNFYAASRFPAHDNHDALAVWDGTQWSFLPSLVLGGISALAVTDNGDVFIGGSINKVDSVPVSHVARWDGQRWSALGKLNGGVTDLVADGNAIYAGGRFSTTGVPDTSVLRWEDGAWQPVGGIGGSAQRLAIDGDDLYAIFGFHNPDTYEDEGAILRWDGKRWEQIATGGMPFDVYAIAARGRHLFAGGSFLTLGGVPSSFVAHWSDCDLDLEFCPLFKGPCGDVDEDDDVDATDALLALKVAVGLGECPAAHCDVNLSGGVSVSDALSILYAAVERPVLLECPVSAPGAVP